MSLSGLSASNAQQVAAESSPAVRSIVTKTAGEFRILALGSSSTQGVGATSARQTYPAQLARLFEETFHDRFAVSVLNRGIGGEDVDDMMKRLSTDVASRKPNLVIWQVGSNDPLRGVPIERFKAEVRKGISDIHATGAEVMLMEPQWSPALAAADASNQFVNAVRDIGAEQNVAVVRRFDLMRSWLASGAAAPRDLIGPDGLHMTDLGYAMLAKAVFNQITTTSRSFRERMAQASTSKNL